MCWFMCSKGWKDEDCCIEYDHLFVVTLGLLISEIHVDIEMMYLSRLIQYIDLGLCVVKWAKLISILYKLS